MLPEDAHLAPRRSFELRCPDSKTRPAEHAAPPGQPALGPSRHPLARNTWGSTGSLTAMLPVKLENRSVSVGGGDGSISPPLMGQGASNEASGGGGGSGLGGRTFIATAGTAGTAGIMAGGGSTGSITLSIGITSVTPHDSDGSSGLGSSSGSGATSSSAARSASWPLRGEEAQEAGGVHAAAAAAPTKGGAAAGGPDKSGTSGIIINDYAGLDDLRLKLLEAMQLWLEDDVVPRRKLTDHVRGLAADAAVLRVAEHMRQLAIERRRREKDWAMFQNMPSGGGSGGGDKLVKARSQGGGGGSSPIPTSPANLPNSEVAQAAVATGTQLPSPSLSPPSSLGSTPGRHFQNFQNFLSAGVQNVQNVQNVHSPRSILRTEFQASPHEDRLGGGSGTPGRGVENSPASASASASPSVKGFVSTPRGGVGVGSPGGGVGYAWLDEGTGRQSAGQVASVGEAETTAPVAAGGDDSTTAEEGASLQAPEEDDDQRERARCQDNARREVEMQREWEDKMAEATGMMVQAAARVAELQAIQEARMHAKKSQREARLSAFLRDMREFNQENKDGLLTTPETPGASGGGDKALTRPGSTTPAKNSSPKAGLDLDLASALGSGKFRTSNTKNLREFIFGLPRANSGVGSGSSIGERRGSAEFSMSDLETSGGEGAGGGDSAGGSSRTSGCLPLGGGGGGEIEAEEGDWREASRKALLGVEMRPYDPSATSGTLLEGSMGSVTLKSETRTDASLDVHIDQGCSSAKGKMTLVGRLRGALKS
eukprot:jgi/Mesen1/6905/ME000353S05927